MDHVVFLSGGSSRCITKQEAIDLGGCGCFSDVGDTDE